jgi:RHS repeat-associated protein
VSALAPRGGHSFIYGPRQTTIEQINNTTGTVTYLHHDQAGSTRLLTGSTGTVTGKCTYSAYGTPTCEGTATTPLGYDGQYTSSDTGLIYLRHRVYDPATAQFLSVDPLVGKTHAPYSYAGDNPVNEADPTGLGNWLNLGLPSPGEVVETLNPVKYYEEEIESYENGCGYFASVAHGLEGAVVGVLDASGAGEGEAVLGEEGGTAIEDALAGLTPGNSPGVYTVDSPEELQQIYDELSAGGKPTNSSYAGQEVELPNGTRVGIRETSKTGGPAVDINTGSARYRIHVTE